MEGRDKSGRRRRRERVLKIGILAEMAAVCMAALIGYRNRAFNAAGSVTSGAADRSVTVDAAGSVTSDAADRSVTVDEAGGVTSDSVADSMADSAGGEALSGAAPMASDEPVMSDNAALDGDSGEGTRDFITWVDYCVTADAMRCALQYDLNTYGTDCHIDWIVLLAYAGCRGGGKFSEKSLIHIRDLAGRLAGKETDVETLSQELIYFDYYYEAYSAVLGGYVGEYEIEVTDADGNVTKKQCYGVKVFSPIAKGFAYSDYDDFGSSRSYGYNRPHLGHDMMGVIGTPIVAIESGYVEALGWNRYGGWRIGIRSFDGRRYYYYAHLRQNYPYAEGLAEGSVVTAGDVIGYMGHTGYSTTENTNNIETVHLHWGLQLIFDESQKDGNNEIWVDCYALTAFLNDYRSEVHKVGDTREWVRTVPMTDPAAAEYLAR